jgi:hypothetical protein
VALSRNANGLKPCAFFLILFAMNKIKKNQHSNVLLKLACFYCRSCELQFANLLLLYIATLSNLTAAIANFFAICTFFA